MMHRLHFSVESVMQSYSVLALVGTLQQRQGALAGMRVDLRARFYAALGLFSCWRFFFIIIFGVIIGDFARIPGHCY